MLLPVNWLEKYVKVDVNTKQLADKLTLSGSNIESIKSVSKDIKNVVVGKILKIKEHENADKLVVCKIDVGEEVLQIVTGAKNMKEQDKVIVAKVGAVLPGDFKIELTDFRGIDSYGMLCSLEELGYNKNVLTKEMQEGILILDDSFEIGEDITTALGIDTEVFEIEITPNRPDCLSIIGLAREAKACLKSELILPEIKIEKEEEDIKDYVNSIQVDTDNCNRYYARVIKDVKIGESPLWMQLDLMNAGIRPVNNLVDITNYVMLECGEPLHAFDLDKINGSKVIVRQANDKEEIETLDGVKRELTKEDIVIADEKEPIAIAGVMGGLDSEITNNTKTVLIEGANFNEQSIRHTSKRFALRSEASFRFEKGVDTKLAKQAADRVCQLVEELNVGTVVGGNIDIVNSLRKEKEVALRFGRVNKVLGTTLSEEESEEYLRYLGLNPRVEDNKIICTIPTYRTDLHIEADLIEEIGRLFGYHNIERKPLEGKMTKGEKPFQRKVARVVGEMLQGFGFNEVMTYSFISPSSFDKLRVDEDSKLRNYVELLNPLGVEYSVMRTTLIPAMLELLSRNYNRKVEEVFAFEIGNIFIPNEKPVETLPKEKKLLSVGFYGDKDFYYLKEAVTKSLRKLGIKDIGFVKESENKTFHPGRTANIICNGKVLGTLGEIHVDVAEAYNIKQRVYMAELDFEEIVNICDLERQYTPLPKYPSVSRDIAVVVNEDILVGDIENVIKKHGKDLVEGIKLFDVYQGGQIEEGKKSVAFSIIYRSQKGTLKDKEVNSIQEVILKDLEDSLGAKLRG